MPKLTADEIEDVLQRSAIVRVGTIAADGYPLIVPTQYVYRNRKILLTARAKVSWLENIRRDPRACLVVDESRYPVRKVTIKGKAEIVYEPGFDDEWRDVRVPLADETTRAPECDEVGQEWTYDAAYRAMTYDEPRALVAIDLDQSRVTSWRLPIEGETLDGSWAPRYFQNEPRKFRVTRSGPRMGDVRVVAE